MDKRNNLRQHFQVEANQAQADKQYKERTAQLSELENTVVQAFNALIRFMDGKTTKTEVVNQLKSISTPDVDKVVTAVSKLDKDILSNKLDLKPVVDALNGMKRELGLIPKSLPKIPEAKDNVKITNLDEIKLDTSDVVSAIKDLKLVAEAPIINEKEVNLKPLQKIMLDLLKAVNNQKPVEIPEFPKIPETDLTKVETKLDKSNKLLKEIVDKPVGGGGGGGGNGTPYVDGTGKPMNVELIGGAVPITGTITAEASTLAEFQFNDSDNTTTASTEYFGYTKPDGTWLVKKLTDTTLRYATITNNGAVTTYADAWVAIASLTYGRMDQAF